MPAAGAVTGYVLENVVTAIRGDFNRNVEAGGRIAQKVRIRMHAGNGLPTRQFVDSRKLRLISTEN
jgi:hypothetical protein